MTASNRRALLGTATVVVTVLAIVFATFATPGSSGVTPPSTRPLPPSLVALGDSVPAGLGTGTSAAYPSIVAAQRGYRVDNLATPGATAATVLDDQLPRIEHAPDLVTLTVGANDIHFAECFAALFGIGTDPCAGDDYTDNLDRFADRLAEVLDRLQDRFPRTRVFVSRYYDPLPASAGALCGLDDATFSGGGIGDRTVRRVARRLFEERLTNWERRLYDRATHDLARLNAVIDRVTTAHDAHLVDVDFSGHDLCAPDAWVFAPDVQARVNFRWPGPDYAENVTHRARTRCTASCGPTVPFATRYHAPVGTLVITGTLGPNGTPHPNEAGQRALARAFLVAIGPR